MEEADSGHYNLPIYIIYYIVGEGAEDKKKICCLSTIYNVGADVLGGPKYRIIKLRRLCDHLRQPLVATRQLC